MLYFLVFSYINVWMWTCSWLSLNFFAFAKYFSRRAGIRPSSLNGFEFVCKIYSKTIVTFESNLPNSLLYLLLLVRVSLFSSPLRVVNWIFKSLISTLYRHSYSSLLVFFSVKSCSSIPSSSKVIFFFYFVGETSVLLRSGCIFVRICKCVKCLLCILSLA